MKHKIIFFGTPWIAKECLEELFNQDQIEILAVVSQPDKEKDRKNNFVVSEVKQFCLDNNITIFQPNKVSDIYLELLQLKPDLIVTCAYGQIIPENILNIPKYRSINVHASLLPKLRGGAPIHWAIINREEKTGITLMYMEKKMDAGNIIFQQAIQISNDETYSSLLKKLALLAREMLKKHINDVCTNNVISFIQDEQKVTFGFNIKKEEEYLNFNNKAIDIDAKVRGLNNKPLAKIIYHNNTYKIYEIKISDHKSNELPGTIVNVSKQGIEIATLDFNIMITKLQAPNKKVLMINEFINGNHDFIINDIINPN